METFGKVKELMHVNFELHIRIAIPELHFSRSIGTFSLSFQMGSLAIVSQVRCLAWVKKGGGGGGGRFCSHQHADQHIATRRG